VRSPRFAALTLAAAFGSVAPHALADVGDSDADYVPEPATRRADFTIGTHIGAAFGRAVGYPNKVEKIDNPRYEANTGLGAGFGGALWIGAALRDWFTFGVGLGQTSVDGSSLTSSGTYFLAHIEGFPLFYQDPFFQDLGVYAEFGAGGRDVNDGSDAVGEGGVMSFVGAGVFWEPLRLGSNFSAGPMLEVTHMFSQSLTSTIGLAGLRLAYYSGP
jgi:hypothetical protein